MRVWCHSTGENASATDRKGSQPRGMNQWDEAFQLTRTMLKAFPNKWRPHYQQAVAASLRKIPWFPQARAAVQVVTQGSWANTSRRKHKRTKATMFSTAESDWGCSTSQNTGLAYACKKIYTTEEALQQTWAQPACRLITVGSGRLKTTACSLQNSAAECHCINVDDSRAIMRCTG